MAHRQTVVAEQAARSVPCNDRCVLNGIFWVLRSGAPSRDLPGNFGLTPPATIASFAGDKRALNRIMNALAATHDAAVQMIKRPLSA